MTLVVQCVDVDSPATDCRDIKQIGFPAESGGITTRTPAQTYDLIEDEGYNIVVEIDGSQTEVDAVKRGTTKYVRSEPNDTKDDNLLKQDNC